MQKLVKYLVSEGELGARTKKAKLKKKCKREWKEKTRGKTTLKEIKGK